MPYTPGVWEPKLPPKINATKMTGFSAEPPGNLFEEGQAREGMS